MTSSRRRFLEYLAASPAAAGLLLSQSLSDFVPGKPEEAINIMDFEAAARKKLPPAHFGYIQTGVEDDITLRTNASAFQHYQLRPRRLVDVSSVDTSVTVFGRKWDFPLALAPAASHRAFWDDGELSVARGAASRKTIQVLSTASTTSVEDVSKAYGEPVWYQLYATSRWDYTERLVKRAEAAGSPVLVVTIDLPTGRKTETEQRYRLLDKRDCSACHVARGISAAGYFRRKPMFDGIDMTGQGLYAPKLTWESIGKIRKMTAMKIVLKGIVTAEDAALCRQHGIDGLVVSNHGGRAEESGRGTIDCLAEVVAAAGPNVTVFIDGGFRRGTDIFKALAMGARAVWVGRPYLWGLGAFGQPGVEAVIDMFKRELSLVMQQCGATSVAGITAAMIRKA